MKSHPVFAFFHPLIEWAGGRMGMNERRRALLEQVEGRVLEIGAGGGANFRHYPQGVDVLATEPDPFMARRARKAARGRPNIELAEALAESLPAEDASVDTVVSTLVLCTVPDVPAALAEVRRVLKPGGRFLVFEHVRSSDPSIARKQDRALPFQRFFAAGCHPNRDTRAALTDAGFDVGDVRDDTMPGPKLIRATIVGAAVNPNSP